LPPVELSKADRRALIDSNSTATFENAYRDLGRALIGRSDELVQAVLDSGASGS